MDQGTLGLMFLGLMSAGGLLTFLNAKANHTRQPHQPNAPKSRDRRVALANGPDPRWGGGYTQSGQWCSAMQCMAHRAENGQIYAVAVSAMDTYHEAYEEARQAHFEAITARNDFDPSVQHDYSPAPRSVPSFSSRSDVPSAPAWTHPHDAPAPIPAPGYALSPMAKPIYNFDGSGDILQPPTDPPPPVPYIPMETPDSGFTREQEYRLNSGLDPYGSEEWSDVHQTPTGPAVVHVRIRRG